MIEFKSIGSATCLAFAPLCIKKTVHVGICKASAVVGLLGSIVRAVDSPLPPNMVNVGCLPSLENYPHAFWVRDRVAPYFSAVASRIFGAAFARPPGLKAGMSGKPPCVLKRVASDAVATRYESHNQMPLSTSLARLVMGQPHVPRSGSQWMPRARGFALSVIYSSTGDAQAVRRVAVSDMTVTTRFASLVELITGRFGLGSLRNWWRHQNVSVITIGVYGKCA